jgi:hypothetical protein
VNLKATADAIAARFTGVTAVVDGKTESLSLVTSSLPNTIGKGPFLLVFHPRGVLDVGVSKLRKDQLDFPVRFLRDPVNFPSRSDALYAWYDVLRDRVEASETLGLSYVAWAQPISTRVEVDGHDYAETTYDVIEFIVRVRFNEVVTTVAP